MTNAIPAVIKMHRWSEVEPGIIARLYGPDLNRARQASETLAKYGSTQAEKALWDRLRKFHEQWAEALAGSATVTETFRATGLQQAMLIIPVLCIALAVVLFTARALSSRT
jgi:hypothetical protein